MATTVNDRDLQLAATSPRVAGVVLPSNVTVPGLAGAITSSKFVELAATSQIFQIPKTGSISPANITVTATIHNLVNTPTLTIAPGGGTMSVTPALTGGTFTFTPAQMTSDTVTLLLSLTEASITYTDTMTFVKCREGIDSINVFLTNENVTIAADTAGNVISYAGASGNIKVFQGINDVTSVCTFGVSSNPGGLTHNLNTTTGSFNISAGFAAGTNQTTLTFTATFGTTVVSKIFTLSKVNAAATGATGAPGVRGSVQLSVGLGGSTAVWSDTTAAAAVVTATGTSPIRLDQVTETNNSVGFVETRVFDGTNWIVASVSINGNLIVNGTVVAASLAVNAVTSTSLASITMTVGKFIQSTSFVSGSSGWRIDANGSAEFAAASIRGQLAAAQINGNGLTINDNSGNPILGVGTNLDNSRITAAAGWLNSNVTVVSGVLTGIGTPSIQVDNSYSLSKAANSILSATVSISATAGAGFVAGTLTWNSSGVRTAGYGVAMTPGGIVAYNTSGVNTFSIDASTGNAFFAGTLAAGVASVGTISSSVANASVTQTGAATSIASGAVTCVTYTTANKDMLLAFNVNVQCTTNTNTPLEIQFSAVVDGVAYQPAGIVPRYELTQSNAKMSLFTGITLYNWGSTNNFAPTFIIPAGTFSAGSHTIGYAISISFLNASGAANTITGSSLFTQGMVTLREFT